MRLWRDVWPLAVRLVKARKDTYPPDFYTDGWQRWLPETEQDLQDVRVWLACLAQAVHQPAVSEAVREAWAREQRELVLHLDPSAYLGVPEMVEGDAEIIRALVLGLAIRRVLDPDLPRERALMLLSRAATALDVRRTA